MTWAVSIDPGTKDCGIAVWEDKVLRRAGLIRQPGNDYGLMLVSDAIAFVQKVSCEVDEIVIEKPQVSVEADLAEILSRAGKS